MHKDGKQSCGTGPEFKPWHSFNFLHLYFCDPCAAGRPRPVERWGNATFVHGDHIYIFGGMYDYVPDIQTDPTAVS